MSPNPPSSIDELLKEASRQHQQGALPQAAHLYEQLLHANPNHPQALAQFGLLQAQQGNIPAAIAHLQRATIFDNTIPDWQNNLGVCHRMAGDNTSAIASCQEAIALKPDYTDAHTNLAIALAATGQTKLALDEYQKVIQLAPTSSAAHTNLGLFLQSLGHFEDAIQSLQRAADLNPNAPQAQTNLANAWCNLANTLRTKKQLQESITAYRKSIQLDPRSHITRNNLSLALLDTGQTSQAIAELQLGLQLSPNFAEGFNNLGVCLRKAGDLTTAATAFRKALQLSNTYCEAASNLASLLIDQGELEKGLATHELAVRLNPQSADALNNYAVALRTSGQFSQAVTMLRKAIIARPDFARAHSNLGAVLRELGQLDEATSACRQAIEIDPTTVEAHNNIANCHRDRGQLDEALASFDAALALDPTAADIESNRVYTMHFHHDFTEQDLANAARNWAQHHAPVSGISPSTGTPGEGRGGGFAAPLIASQNRRLRIGYYSPDFRRHAAASFILPLLANHNPEQVEIFCYSGVKRPDDITTNIRALAHHWRSTVGVSDVALAEMIHNDRVDILVDLTLHMADNRLLVFARRPAPVQVSWLGYPGTTGMSEIDYRISDWHLDPDVGHDAIYAGRTVRLPNSFWCYEPIAKTPAVNDLPAIAAGHFTFGSFNNFCKVTPQTLALWAKTLRAIPGARMIIQSQPGGHRQDVLKQLHSQGIDSKRIEFIGLMRDADYFKLYHRVDACLDPIPYPGHTTTLDSLWMGVPVVTLIGRTAVSRGGASILRSAGLNEFVADSEENYVQIAASLAGDLPRARSLRQNLRQQLQSSPLMNGKQFAADMENIFRQMWQNCCQTTHARAA